MSLDGMEGYSIFRKMGTRLQEKQVSGSKTIGIFGGTFDPIHLGHLAVAQAAAEELRLDRVVFVPAGSPPHKQRRHITPAAKRLAMVALAVKGNPRFEVSDYEIASSGPSFTVSTLEHFASRGWGRLYLLIGLDQARSLDTWRNPQRLFSLARVVVLSRPGFRLEEIPPTWRSRIRLLNVPYLDISSSRIRRLAARGRSVRYLVPEPVAGYISRHRLYRGSDGARI